MIRASLNNRINELFKSINLSDPYSKEETERILSSIKSKEDLHALAQCAKKENFKVKYYVIKHLGKFENDTSIRELVGYLSDKNGSIRSIAESTLTSIRSESKYKFLLPAIEAREHSMRIYAIKALGRGEQVSATLPLLELLEDENPEIRFQTIDSLRLIKDHRANDRVAKCLDDPVERVCFAAAFYCGCRRIKKACGDLLSHMNDENPKIRSTCVWALGQIEDIPSIIKLKGFLKSEKDKNVKNEIFRVMHKIGIVKIYRANELFQTGDDDPTKGISDWLLTFIMSQSKPKIADICLFVEGAYPYISGGVSSWIRDLLSHFTDLTFSIVHIAASRSEIREFKYNLPRNVLYFKELYLYDMPDFTKKRIRNPEWKEHQFNMIFSFMTSMNEMNEESIEMICQKLGVLEDFQLDPVDLFKSRYAWKFLRRLYDYFLEDVPFIEFIWNYRSIALPIYNILKSRIPPARIYYSPLTGYAGLLAMFAGILYKKPRILTEHGIYHRERMMEINQAGWIYEEDFQDFAGRPAFGGMKKVWIEMYRAFSSLAYRFADEVTTLNKDNALMQVESGADPAKITVIPNGIVLKNFAHINKEDFAGKKEFTVGLVGRVVPIKDIKTFIWTARKVVDKMPGRIKFLVMGPYSENKEYAEECFALTNMLNLDKVVIYTGTVDLREYFKIVDLVILTSISEGQPLSLMEAMAAGIPCVATHVGSCKELLYGRGRNDSQLGHSGIITNVHSPGETANAIIRILGDPTLYKRMSRVGRTRIELYYQLEDIFEMYRVKFNKYLRK